MNLFSWIMWSVWGGSALSLAILLLYRGCLMLYEEDSLFLDDNIKHHRQLFTETVTRVNRVEPWVSMTGRAAGVTTAVLGIFYMVDSILRLNS